MKTLQDNKLDEESIDFRKNKATYKYKKMSQYRYVLGIKYYNNIKIIRAIYARGLKLIIQQYDT